MPNEKPYTTDWSEALIEPPERLARAVVGRNMPEESHSATFALVHRSVEHGMPCFDGIAREVPNIHIMVCFQRLLDFVKGRFELTECRVERNVLGTF